MFSTKHERRPDRFWANTAWILLILGLLATAHDVWYVVTGQNGDWWPFLWPAIFLPGAVALRFYGRKIDGQDLVHLTKDAIDNPDGAIARERVERLKALDTNDHRLIG